MVKDVRQIEREMGAIEETVSSMAQELRHVYEQYLHRLGQTVQQQLVLVSYQICTKTYPEAFVKLSYSQREKFQQSLQQLAKGATSALLQCLEMPSETEETTEIEEDIESVVIPNLNIPQPFAGAEIPTPLESESESEEINPNDPQAALQWYQDVESAIALSLEDLSRQANALLQGVGILPDIPPKLLEIAMQAEEVTNMGTPNTPNLLNLLIEEKEKSEDEDEERAVTRLAVIRLRLNDLEFADTVLSIERKKIRDRANKLTSLQKNYRKKQQEKLIAQADAAWRSSWYEES
jgi:hypothetical protein